MFLLLSMKMQGNGAADKTSGSVPEQTVKTEVTEDSKTIPATDTASSGFLGNLLVVPMDGSHWVEAKALAQEMGRRGHRVTVVMPEITLKIGPGKYYDTMTYPVPFDKTEMDSVMASQKELMRKSAQNFPNKMIAHVTQIQKIRNILHISAESLLFNASLISHLSQQVSTNTDTEHKIYHKVLL